MSFWGSEGYPALRPQGHNSRKKKMDIIATFATDEKLETEGKWFPLSKTASVLVARAGNDKYSSLLRAKAQEAQIDMTAGEEAEKLAEELLLSVTAETVLLGWKGITADGKEVPYSKGQALTYLRVKDFRRKIEGFANNFESFRKKAEAEQGNA